MNDGGGILFFMKIIFQFCSVFRNKMSCTNITPNQNKVFKHTHLCDSFVHISMVLYVHYVKYMLQLKSFVLFYHHSSLKIVQTADRFKTFTVILVDKVILLRFTLLVDWTNIERPCPSGWSIVWRSDLHLH